ncbi:MAG: PAS domain S-box protein [Bacteroidia bacterium]|nr:PAS domain S-box protein [Bacteroidia bacterium]
MKKMIKLILILTVIITFLSCNKVKNISPVVKQGVLDLSSWDFEKDGSIKMDGEWEFYWNRLYAPEDFKNNIAEHTSYIQVPGTWNEQKVTSQPLPGKGFGTYHLKIKLNHSYDILGIRTSGAASAYKLWVNGKVIASNGKVSAIAGQMIPQYLPVLTGMVVNAEELEIIVQVANNFHSKGGLWDTVELGKLEQLMKEREHTTVYELFLIGIMFILFIYHIWIFLLRKSEKIALWFGLLCFTLLLRTIVTDERFLYVLFPGFNLNFGLRLEYICLSMGSLLYGVFVYYLFPLDFSKKVLKIALGLTIIELVIILFTNTEFYTSLLLWYQVSVIAIAFYLLVIVSPKSIVHKRFGAIPFFISILILIACVVNDILSSRLIIQTIYLTPFGFFLTILLQAYILASRISFAFGTMEKSTEKLSEMNIMLEQKFEQVEQSEKKFRNIINTTSLLICIMDPKSILTFVSPSFKRSLGYKTEEMEGRPASDFIHPDDIKAVYDTFEKATLNPRKLLIIEGRLIAKNGEYMDVEIRANALYESRKVISGAIVMMNDITDRKIAQRTQEENQKMLEFKVEERTLQLKAEKKKSDDLLLNILPEEVAEELKHSGRSEARQYEQVTVMFTDFVNFTGISQELTPKELVSEVDYCFKGFDDIMERHGLEKIKTIGDAYLAVCGLPNENKHHAIKAASAALDIIKFIKTRKEAGGLFEIRIGLHSGSVVAGIVGSKKFAYDIWGDAVNTASRMENCSEAGKINISESTYQLIKEAYSCNHRGKIEAKNKGLTDMYFINS